MSIASEFEVATFGVDLEFGIPTASNTSRRASSNKNARARVLIKKDASLKHSKAAFAKATGPLTMASAAT